MKQYVYYVVFEKSNKLFRYEVTREKEIKSIDDIIEIEDLTGGIVVNYKLLRVEGEEDEKGVLLCVNCKRYNCEYRYKSDVRGCSLKYK